MAGSRDVQFLELKDTINQLNTTIRNQNDLIASLNKRIEEQAATIVEPEYVEVPTHKRARKPRATYDEFFENLPAHKVYVDTLTDEQKKCGLCGTQMVPIG